MLPDDNAGGRDAGVQQGLEPLIPIGGKLQNAIVGREGYRERTKSELIWTQNQSLLNTMSHTLVIVLAVIGISSELHTLWLIRQFGPQLTTPLRVALWIKLLSAVSLLISAGLLLITTRMESLLDATLIVSIGVWVASILAYGILRSALPRKATAKSA